MISSNDSSSQSESPVVILCSPDHQQNDESINWSSESSSSSRVSSITYSPDRNSHSRSSSKESSRSRESDKETKEPHDNYLSDISDEDLMENTNYDNASQKSDNDTPSLSKEIVISVNGHVDDKTEVEEEIKIEESEEGEIFDEGEEETETKSICRFYLSGRCNWGARCRFLHQGVVDQKKNSMFKIVRSIPSGLPSLHLNDSYLETDWERELRQVKESTKKKMNLTSNQEKVGKKNDYYAQRPTIPTASPALRNPIERVVEHGKINCEPDKKARHHRGPPPDAYVDEFMPPPVDFYHHRPAFGGPRHGPIPPYFLLRQPIDNHAPRPKIPFNPYQLTETYYHPGFKPHHRGLPPRHPSNRVVIMQRSKIPYRRDMSSIRPRLGDNWSNPWMRSKSPGGRSIIPATIHTPSSTESASGSSSVSSDSSGLESSSEVGSSDQMDTPTIPPVLKERNPSSDTFDKKPMSQSMNPSVPTNRLSVSSTYTPVSIQPEPRARQMPISLRFAVIKPNSAKSPATTHIYSSSSSSESASGTGSSESSDSSVSESSDSSGSESSDSSGSESSDSSGSESSSEVGSPDQMETPTVPPVLKEKSVSQEKKRSLESDNDDNKSSSPPRKKRAAAPSKQEELLKELK